MLCEEVCFRDQAQREPFQVAVWRKAEALSPRFSHRMRSTCGEPKAWQQRLKGGQVHAKSNQPTLARTRLETDRTDGFTDVMASSQATHELCSKRPTDGSTPFPTPPGHRHRRSKMALRHEDVSTEDDDGALDLQAVEGHGKSAWIPHRSALPSHASMVHEQREGVLLINATTFVRRAVVHRRFLCAEEVTAVQQSDPRRPACAGQEPAPNRAIPRRPREVSASC